MYTLKIEAIGDNHDQAIRSLSATCDSLLGRGAGDAMIGKMPASYFVAEITGLHPKFKYERKFIRGQKDYSEANSVGSRGVYVYYYLEEGKIYDVKKPVSWKNDRRFFCRIQGYSLIELDEHEVKACLEFWKDRGVEHV